MNAARSLWRDSTMWLIFGLPAVAVAASVGLLVSAVRSGGDSEVIDTVDHSAEMQVADTRADERAGKQGLSAVLRLEGESIEVLPVSGHFDRAANLELHIAHPTRANADVHATLTPTERGWQAARVADNDNDWVVKLESRDGSWRLRGRLQRGQQTVLLKPALPGT